MFEAAVKQICQSSTQNFMLCAFVYLERLLFLTFRVPSGPQLEGGNRAIAYRTIFKS